jgi:hypothetical protein
LQYLIDKFNSDVKPKWCTKLQIYVDVRVGIFNDENYKPSAKFVKKIKRLFVDFQRKNQAKLKSSWFGMAPVKSEIDDFPYFISFALARMETKDAKIEYCFSAT